MGRKSHLISDELHKKAVSELAKSSQTSRAGVRLQAIISTKTQGIGVVSKVFGVTANTVRSWIYSFKNSEKTEDLEFKKGRGRKCKIGPEHHEIIQKWVAENCTITLKEICLRLEEELGLKTCKTTVHNLLKKFRFSYITPRPVHYKQDKSQHDLFKKKSKS